MGHLKLQVVKNENEQEHIVPVNNNESCTDKLKF